jgi:uncharacterized protein (DUF58 family)
MTDTTSGGTRSRASTVTRVPGEATGVLGGGVARVRHGLLVALAGARRVLRWLGTTVTVAGWLVVAVTAAGLAAGLAFGWTVGWVAAVAGALLLALCVPFLLGGHDYRVRLQLEKDRVVAGSTVRAALRVTNAAPRLSLPGMVDVPIGAGLVEAHVPLLGPGAVHEEELAIAARRRGVIDVGPLSVGRGDPIGILRRVVSWPEVQTLHVHPVTTAIPSTSAGVMRDLEGLPTSDIVDSDLAFHAIREYLPGDSPRHVHWRSTAKAGTLMVRQYEETRNARIAVVIGTVDEEEYASDDEFELAVSVAASLGLQALREGRELVVTTSADAADAGPQVALRQIPTRTPQTMLDGFAEVEAAPHASRLEDVARLTGQDRTALSIAFLVTGSRLPLDRLRAAAWAFGEDAQTVVVRCEENAEPTLRRAGRMRVITVGALGDLGQLIARGALA